MNVYIITVGDEILIGQIIDTNSAWMGQQLNLIGASIEKIVSVPDEQPAIDSALREGMELADVILITGGLGPTKDDITKKALADFMGVELRFHEPSWERIQRFFKHLGRTPTAAHREQCYLPANVETLYNKMGTAPGMWFDHQGDVIVSMPGVPYEMKYLMEQEVLPRLTHKFPARPIGHRTILTVGLEESRIAERIDSFEQALPDSFKIAYLPNLGRVRLRLTGRGEEQHALDQELDAKAAELRSLVKDIYYGMDQDLLEAKVGEQLQHRNLTLATAESCTGGHIAHLITSVAGSSAYFQGSIVAYDNDVKVKLLGVNPQTLIEHGAVSEQCVREMVSGVRQQLGTDIGIAISGIAGPGGGSAEKPVGTIWMAVGNATHTETFLLRAGKDRLKNIQYASVYALNLIRKFLLQQYPVVEV